MYKYTGIEPIYGFDSIRFEETSGYFKKLYSNIISIASTDSIYSLYRKGFGKFRNNELDQPI